MNDGSEGGTNRVFAAALDRIFRALARLCIRHGVSFDAAAEIAKRAFVDVAHHEFGIPGRKQSASRVALLTGLHRKEVARMMVVERPRDVGAEARIAYSARVISGWRRDPDYADSRGLPAALEFDQGNRSFAALVKRHGGHDLPARAVLDELARVGAVKRTRDGRLRLVARGYVPMTASAESIELVGEDVGDLLATFDHNLSSPASDGWFQRRVAYDNLPQEAIASIHAEVRRAGQALLERLDGQMARSDRDSNPKAKGTGRHRVTVGIYFRLEDLLQTEPESSGDTRSEVEE